MPPFFKQCPDCGSAVHVRKLRCPCGYVFPKKKISQGQAKDIATRQARKRALETELESEQRRVADATRQASKRALESDSDTEQRRTADTFRVAKKRALETQEQSEQRKTADRVRKANKKHLERCSLQSVIDSFASCNYPAVSSCNYTQIALKSM